MNKRMEELDSLRGLAALTVVFHHYLLIFPAILDSQNNGLTSNFIKIIKFSPLHIFWAGHEAVIFFFILSGFVLSLPFYSSKKGVVYSQFLIKRIFRIYIPYIIAVIIAIAMYYLTYKGGITELSSWFNSRKNVVVDPKLILNHIVLLGSFKNGVFDPVLWSLIQEMRISIIFPFLMYFVVKFNWKKNIFIGLCLSLFSFCSNYLASRFLNVTNDYLITFHYMSLFIYGALLAKYRDRLILIVRNKSKLIKYTMVLIGILLYTNMWYLNNIRIFQLAIVGDNVIALGVIIFIVLSLSSITISRVLVNKYVHFMGKISYSLYLYHAICLLTLLNILYGKIPIALILIIAFITSFIVSALSYYTVEITSINIGKKLSKKIGNQNKITENFMKTN